MRPPTARFAYRLLLVALLLTIAPITLYAEDAPGAAPVEFDRLPHPDAREAARRFEAQLAELEVRQNIRLANSLRGVLEDLTSAHERAVERGDVTAAEATRRIIQRTEGKVERFAEFNYEETSDLATPLVEEVLGDEDLPANVESVAKALERIGRRIDDQFLGSKQRLLIEYVEALADPIRDLLGNDEYEAARIVETERNRRRAQVQEIRDIRRSGGWQVVFRSHDPSIWNRDVREGEDHFAVNLARHRRFNGYLRLRRMDTGEYVILRLRANDLTDNTEVPGGYMWRGDAKQQVRTTRSGHRRENYRLGIVDRSRERTYRSSGGYIVSLSGRGRGHGGWGFGKTALVYSDQRYLWADEEMREPVIFEIVLKRRALTSEEQARVLNQ